MKISVNEIVSWNVVCLQSVLVMSRAMNSGTHPTDDKYGTKFVGLAKTYTVPRVKTSGG